MPSNGPAVIASSKYDLGTDRYHTRSCMWRKSCMPLKYLLNWLMVWTCVCAWRNSSIDCICAAICGPTPAKLRPSMANMRCAEYSSGEMPVRNSLSVLM